MSLPFINDDCWKIELNKIPKYPDFQGQFKQPLDYHLLNLFDGTPLKQISEEMKSSLKNNILSKMDKNSGGLIVHQNQTHGLGRFYGSENITIIPHSKYIKHTLFSYLGWLDIDMVKGHPTIALEMGKRIGKSFPSFENYVTNFDSIASEFIKFYNADENEHPLDDDDIKYLFVMMIYGGGFERWKLEMIEDTPKKREKGYFPKSIKNADIFHPTAVLFKRECKQIGDMIFASNKLLMNKLKKEDDEIYETKNRVTSYWFQIIENHIVYLVYQFLVDRNIIKNRIFGLEYYGLCIPPVAFDFDKIALINDVNNHIKLVTGLNIKFKFKGYSEKYIISSIIEIRKTIPNPIIYNNDDISNNFNEPMPKTIYTTKQYLIWKQKFEIEFCKIKNTANFIRICKDENRTFLKYIILTEKQIKTSYKHECFWKKDKNGESSKQVSCIDTWLNDPDMKCYDDADIYPPPLKCPANNLNLWRPSPYDNNDNKLVDELGKEGVDMFFNHIKILCNHETLIFEYVCCWLAQMIQIPSQKTSHLIFISEEGAGKNIFVSTLGKILGHGKVLETSSPEKDVWGSFNSLMTSAFLVILNEVDKRNCYNADGRIKSLITDEMMTINGKGKDQFTIKSYHRYISITNNHDPYQTHKNDRRNAIIRSSDERVGDFEYFKKLTDKLNCPITLKGIYIFLKNKDISKWDFRSIPHTKFQENIIEGNRPVLECLMENFTIKNRDKEYIDLYGKNMYNKFIEWKERTGYILDVRGCGEFVKKLKNSLKLLDDTIITLPRDTNGIKQRYDILKLKTRFQILNECFIPKNNDDEIDDSIDSDDDMVEAE